MTIKTKLFSTATALPLIMAVGMSQSYAQSTAQGGTEELVVTARRVSENIEKVPQVVTAFNAASIANRGMKTEEDIQLATPGLTLRQTEGQNQLTYSIRGQTIDGFTGSATAVVPYTNEVQANSQGAASFYDLESIQVLKGPQGTLFGRNSTGGAVLYGTAKPTDKFGGYFQLSGGNYNYYEGQGAINVPLVEDKVLARLAFDIAGRDGYQTNVFYGTKLGVMARKSVRASVTVKPSDAIENTTVFEYSHSGGNNTSVVLYSAYNPGDRGPDGSLLNPAASATYNPTTFDAIFGPGGWARWIAANPGITRSQPNALQVGLPGYLAYRATQPFYNVGTFVGSTHKEDSYFVSNTTTLNVTDDMKLKNIFGYTQDRALDDAGEFGAPYPVQYTENLGLQQYGNDVLVKNISDEVQAQGKAFDQSLTYILGGYYQHSKTITFYPQTYFSFLPLAPGVYVTSDYRTVDENKAVFGQVTYDLSKIGVEGLKFTAGGRYSWEDISLLHLPGSTNRAGSPGQSISFSKPSWTFGLDYQVNDALMVYATTRGSWRSGGFNGNAPPRNLTASNGGTLAGDIFLPETAKDVEIGAKLSGDMMDRPAHVNVALYKSWIDGVQRSEFPTEPGTGNSIAVTVNVPKGIVQGFEVETSVMPASWLTVGGTLSYTDAKYTQNSVIVFGTNYIFGPWADVAPWSGSAFAQIALPIPETAGDLSLRGDIYAQDRQYFSNNAGSFIPGTRMPGYSLVNFRLTWSEIMGSKITAAVYAKNAFDKHYYVGGLAQGASFGTNAAAIGRPRMVGVDLKYTF